MNDTREAESAVYSVQGAGWAGNSPVLPPVGPYPFVMLFRSAVQCFGAAFSY